MDKIKKNIEKILDQFLFEARPIWPMSQFAIIALKNSILQEIDKNDKKQEPVKKQEPE